jgi:hypothetical protein
MAEKPTKTESFTSMNITARRIAAGITLAAAPALIAIGVATATSRAETTVVDHGPSITHPTTHQSFPHQNNIPVPGSREHHRHQWNHMQ